MKRHMHTHSRTKTNNKRTLNRILTEKNAEEIESDKRAQTKTIQDLVRDLKLKVEATGVVEIVPPDDNPESILPHTGGQNLEYTVTSTADTVNTDRDPLEANDLNIRTTDNM